MSVWRFDFRRWYVILRYYVKKIMFFLGKDDGIERIEVLSKCVVLIFRYESEDILRVSLVFLGFLELY